ncbi:MAG: dTDP-4-dehydrorhamnose reductase [Candidatus Dormibacteria bacterium]
MRFLVTGAGGQLGGEVVLAAQSSGHHVAGVDRSQCDIATVGGAAAAIAEYRPDVVINCAGWTNVDGAEDAVDAAYRANALGARLLAAACHGQGVLLSHVSTDFIFDGSATEPVSEWAAPRPLGVYGASKLAGEQEVRRLCPRHQVVRTSWLFGRDGPNFVLTILRLARERPTLRVVADQTGSPTWTGHLAPALVRLAELNVPGTYHLSGAGAVSWHGFAQAIVETAGFDRVTVDPISTADYPTPARRPAYSVLDNRAWRLLGESPLPEWREGLTQYLAAHPRRAGP